jgi:hypothetical protein
MAKKMNKTQQKSVVNFDTPYRILEDGNVENVMQDNFLRYSMSVIVARALPDVRDGLKPVHRQSERLRKMLSIWTRKSTSLSKSAPTSARSRKSRRPCPSRSRISSESVRRTTVRSAKSSTGTTRTAKKKSSICSSSKRSSRPRGKRA